MTTLYIIIVEEKDEETFFGPFPCELVARQYGDAAHKDMPLACIRLEHLVVPYRVQSVEVKMRPS